MIIHLLVASAAISDCEYADSDKKIISKLYEGTVIFDVPQNVEEFQTIADERSATLSCINTLEIVNFPDGSKLKSINSYMFYKCAKIKTMNLSNCRYVTVIQKNAFYDCKKLQSIIFPPNVQSLGDYSFAYCNSLTSVNLTSKLEVIHQYCFFWCNSIPMITIPSSLVHIYQTAFGDCRKLTQINYQNNSKLQTWDSWSLVNTAIESLYFPSTVTNIGSSIFEGVTTIKTLILEPNEKFDFANGLLFNKQSNVLLFALPTITGSPEVPKNTRTFSSNAFKMCTSLTELIMPNSVTGLPGGDHFYGASSLRRVVLSSGLTEIPKMCFKNCVSLTSVEVPNGVKKICYQAFENCTSLAALSLPDSVSEMEYLVFNLCSEDLKIEFSDGADMMFEGGVLYNRAKSLLVASYCANKTFRILDTVRTITGYAFMENAVETIVIDQKNSRLEEIGKGAFQKSKLKSIIIPDSVKRIDANAFSDCYQLSSVTLSSSLTNISQECFTNAIFDSIEIPASVKEIQSSAFSGCQNLKNVTFLDGSILYLIGEFAFKNTKGLNRIEISSNVNSTGIRIFEGSGVTIVSFKTDSKLPHVMYQSFSKATFLQTVALPDTVEFIDEEAFSGCSSLTSLILPRDVRNISFKAFSDCTQLNKITLQTSSRLETVMGQAFLNCNGLKTFDILPGAPFTFKDGLLLNEASSRIITYLQANPATHLEIPDTVSVINSYAFQNSINLQFICIGSSVAEIGFRAFDGCTSLKKLIINSSNVFISSFAFNDCQLGCDGIVADIILKPQLVAAGIPDSAYIHCPTATFTFQQSISPSLSESLLIAIIFDKDE